MPRKDKDSYNEYMRNYQKGVRSTLMFSRQEILERIVYLLENKDLQGMEENKEIEFEIKILKWVIKIE